MQSNHLGISKKKNINEISFNAIDILSGNGQADLFQSLKDRRRENDKLIDERLSTKDS